MQIEILTYGFVLTDSLRNHAERRLRFSLSSSDEHVQRIEMRLSDIYDSRGGTDKCCHLRVVLSGLPEVIVE